MKIFKNIADWQKERKTINRSIGFVPTMGALHRGHISLMQQAMQQCDYTVVSIFLNPTQFNNQSDLDKYPMQIEQDLQWLKQIGIDAVIMPDYEQIYPDDYQFKVIHSGEDVDCLCGATRPGHFDGVLTVVLKLLQVVNPAKAFFGEKDFQQYRLIKGMSEAFFLPVEIVPCPIVRDENGLALSSRNARLSSQQRKEVATNFSKALQHCAIKRGDLQHLKEQLEEQGYKVDYLEQRWGRLFAAIWVDEVRLIDNVAY